MIILGNKHIEHPTFEKVYKIADIIHTKPNCILLFDYEIDIIKYCNKNNLQSAVIVNNITQAIFCNNLNSSFIITNKQKALEIQKIAQSYMFDSKIAQIINNDDEIEQLALNEIDACIYEDLI